jgi:two-component system sensor histidine kinase ChvG
MNLRRQLLLVSLLLLSLPWAGCQFVREMEGALRHGQEQSLQATTQAIAAVLNNKPEIIYPKLDRLSSPGDTAASVYASARKESVIVDGYADGWDERKPFRYASEDGTTPLGVSYQAVIREDKLYMLFRVTDAKVIYHNQGLSREPNGDRLLIRTWQNNQRQDYVIATAAPGSVRAKFASPIDPGTRASIIRGQWQDSEHGYTLELEIPLWATGNRLGFYIINATGKTGEKFQTLGNITPLDTAAPPWLIYTPQALQNAIAPFGQSGRTLEVIDKQHWLVGSTTTENGTSRETRDRAGETFWLVQALYRSILAKDALNERPASAIFGQTAGVEIDQALSGHSANQRYRDPNYSNRTILTATSPVWSNGEVVAAVLISQSSEEYLSLTDQAFNRLLGYSLAAIGIGIFGLLAYASILSWRIRSLSRAAHNAMRADGALADNFPRSRIPDELGELSRSYADLLNKLGQYHQYLRTLSSKLSHELRTPIAVIQTSLENFEQYRNKTADDEIYLSRAKGGLARLAKILSAMSEANGLEESIRSNPKTPLDLCPLLKEVFGAYKTVYRQHKLIFDCQPEQAMTIAAPELLVQALDKLMANAASFCPTGADITLQLKGKDNHWIIAVTNEGPLLPDDMQGQLFNSMVSVRDKGTDNVHLGLGLHIASLIADYHEGQVEIRNLDDGSGVRCSLMLNANLETPFA